MQICTCKNTIYETLNNAPGVIIVYGKMLIYSGDRGIFKIFEFLKGNILARELK